MYKQIKPFIVVISKILLLNIVTASLAQVPSNVQTSSSNKALSCVSVNSSFPNSVPESHHSSGSTMLRSTSTETYVYLGYASGTNFGVNGHVVWITPPDQQGLRSVTITISGLAKDGKTQIQQIVSSHTWGAPNNVQSWMQSVKINTSAFLNYSFIKQKNEVTSWGGVYGTNLYEYQVINNSYILDNQTFNGAILKPADNSRSKIASSMSHIGYWVTQNNSDIANTIIANIPDYQVFYISTHGGPGNFMDCLSEDDADVNIHEVDAANIVKSILAKNYLQPPYNLVYLTGCNVFGDFAASPPSVNDNIAGSFMIGKLGGWTGSPDRAIMGWDDTMATDNLYGFDEGVFADLLKGQDLYKAVVTNYVKYQPKARHFNSFHYPYFFTRFPKIYGDKHMTLNSVYAAYLPPSIWWKNTYDGPE